MGQNGKTCQKACLITIFQIVLVILAYTIIGMNYQFEQSIKPEVKCMAVSDTRKLCLSVFQRNNSIIPSNKGFQVDSLNLKKFKLLEFQSNLLTTKSEQISPIQFLHLIKYDDSLKSIEDVQIDKEIPGIREFLKSQKGQLRQKAVFKTKVHFNVQFSVFYFVMQNYGPILPSPQIKITYPNKNSILINNKFNMIESFTIVIILVMWTVYKFMIKDEKKGGIWEGQEISNVSRIIQFLINFGMNNFIYFLTINHFWRVYGLSIINETLRFETILVPLYQGNIIISYVNLFPEWLLLSYFIYLVLQRYVTWTGVGLILLSGLSGAVLFFMPLQWPQFIFELAVIGLGVIMSISIKSNSNNKLTVSLMFTALTLILMIIIKMKEVEQGNQTNDFMLRFFFNQLFIVNNFLSFFLKEQQINAKDQRKYVPYEEYSMQEEHQLEQNQTVPHAEKIVSQEG